MREIANPHDKTISKTLRKQASRDLQKLGQELAQLPIEKLHVLPIDNELDAAITQLRNTKSHIARKRQMQYVGKLLRSRDVEELIEALTAFEQQSKTVVASQHRAEAWRDYLLEHADTGLQALLTHCQHIDRQQLRTLIRQTRQEIKHEKPPASKRKLYRLLHQTDQQTSLPDLPAPLETTSG